MKFEHRTGSNCPKICSNRKLLSLKSPNNNRKYFVPTTSLFLFDIYLYFMKQIIITENQLANIAKKLNKNKNVVNEGGDMNVSNYMFFGNIEQMHRQLGLLLELDPQMVDSILQNGHDWADDHISEAKTNIDQVFDFMMNEIQ